MGGEGFLPVYILQTQTQTQTQPQPQKVDSALSLPRRISPLRHGLDLLVVVCLQQPPQLVYAVGERDEPRSRIDRQEN